METEIEIKFLFSADFEQELFNTIKSQQVISTKEQLLHNVYFDTSDRSLRKMDMGLRVRSCDNRSVQTIKTSGRVIGGLHQRPEYNEPIEGGRPELARFNSKIWPDECDIKALENELVPIFSTDFTRQTWLLEMSEATLIEVAYDRGFIEAKQDKKDICEIELELIKGDEKQLFILAEQIALLPQVRLSNVSKAQRGYMLGDQTEFVVKPLLESPLLPSMSIAQALMTNIQHGLRHIQYHENCYLESYQDAALNELVVGIKFVHQNLSLFKDHSPMLLKAPWIEGLHWLARSFSWLELHSDNQNLLNNKGYYLRKITKYKKLLKQIEQQDNSLPSQESICALLHSSRYCQFVLSLTQWLIQLEKNTFASEKSHEIKEFACQRLSEVWQSFREVLQNHGDNQLLAYQGLLEGNLLMGLSVANLFSHDDYFNFYAPWLDIKQGLKELSMIKIVDDFAEIETDKARQLDYFRWIKRKQESLSHALEQSKQQALLKESFWNEKLSD
ncbi:CYTH domain-containing protein [Psychromonas sp. MME2]|uniref:CYTH domain-containing protein n=1 Tax=Psychromonas sp. MME2 TaxID=3231033 RepID=UPI00339C9DE7